MGEPYSDEEREHVRKTFAKHRKAGSSIAKSAEKAGISPTTYYAWNDDGRWKKSNGWSKGDGWSK